MAHPYGRRPLRPPTAAEVAKARADQLLAKAQETENRELSQGYRDRADDVRYQAMTFHERAVLIGHYLDKADKARDARDSALAEGYESVVRRLRAFQPPPGAASPGDLLDRGEFLAKAAEAHNRGDSTLEAGYRAQAAEITRRMPRT
jgi:hypothetical protein